MLVNATGEVVIFCESYPQIENALYVATHHCHNHPITLVITGNSDLFKFFQVINERVFRSTTRRVYSTNVVYFENYQGQIAKAGSKIQKAFHLLPDIVKERRHLKGIFDKHFAKLTGAQVFFFGKCSNPGTFYLLKKLGKTNSLVYMPESAYDALTIEKAAPTNITELVNLARFKLVYGHDIVMVNFPYMRGVPCMPEKFFSKNVDKVISREERDSMLKDFDLSRFKVFDVGDYSVMYFHEDLDRLGYVSDTETFKRELTRVLDILGKHFPANKVARKYHPNSGGTKTMIQFGDVLPDFIPAEFLFNEKVKMYLGLCSRALANVEKGLPVSLMDLVTFRNDRTRDELKKILIQWSRSEILFPKSLGEFERILTDLGKQGK